MKEAVAKTCNAEIITSDPRSAEKQQREETVEPRFNTEEEQSRWPVIYSAEENKSQWKSRDLDMTRFILQI